MSLPCGRPCHASSRSTKPSLPPTVARSPQRLVLSLGLCSSGGALGRVCRPQAAGLERIEDGGRVHCDADVVPAEE